MIAPSATVDAALRFLGEGLSDGGGYRRVARKLQQAGIPTVPPGRRWTAKRVARLVDSVEWRHLTPAQQAEAQRLNIIAGDVLAAGAGSGGAHG